MVQPKLPKFVAPPGYRTQAIDISQEADLLDFYLLAQRSVTERVEIAADLMSSARELSLQCLSRQFNYLTAHQLARKLAEAWLQDDCPPGYVPGGSAVTWVQNSIELAAHLHNVFEMANLDYFITGGVAAIAYGDPRTTRDLDIVLRVTSAAIPTLQATLEQAGFYVAGSNDAAAGRMNSLQITHLETISRADLILSNDSAYAQEQFMRRRRYAFPNQTEVFLSSPEDVIISKLRWGRSSESEKQQRDVLAIFKVQQDALDYSYLFRWGAEFGLSEKLEQLTTAAGVRSVADRQWASTLYPIMMQTFSMAQAMGQTALTARGDEVANGRLYILSKLSKAQIFSILAKADGRLVARFDNQGQVFEAQPSLLDRRQWNDIDARLQKLAQQPEPPDQESEL
ncbi:hypothetical protein IQ241_07630 [Romeria aff. gracilis LEGE 07310]|uniref:Uncharacterized protein n=1 Tax=Vasconcelosia minhoensis LEGE 07310 TaxID=915328 RepID=A0A8J7DLF5_9CYAN|nr:hypothetical protein [Romeria gracilis]MBE9077166.1 hypothetical protein [Romeria aff. gracilis LEGE 07310]